MTFFSPETEPGIESTILDLDAVSLPELRTLDSQAIHQSMRHAVDQASHPRITHSGGGDSAFVNGPEMA